MHTYITIFGAAGRMGKTLIGLIDESENLKLSGALDHVQSEYINKSVTEVIGELDRTDAKVKFLADPLQAILSADVVIDFALAENIEQRIQACIAARIPMVIGTTGLNDEQLALIRVAGDSIPILLSSNMSLGVNAVFALAAHAAKSLGHEFKIKIEETHHVHKKDAPSGTALSIGDVIGDAMGAIDIAYESFREGEVVGDHTVIFESKNERIEIKHHAKDRALFAEGALSLAQRLIKKEPGSYRVRDLI